MVIWPPFGVVALYGRYTWSIYYLCSVDFIYCDWTVSGLIFSTDSFSVCVDGHSIIWLSILASSAPLDSRRWKYALLLSTVLSKVQSVTWLLIMLCYMLVMS